MCIIFTVVGASTSKIFREINFKRFSNNNNKKKDFREIPTLINF